MYYNKNVTYTVSGDERKGGRGRGRWKKGRKGEGGRGRERNPSCPVAEGSGVQVLSWLNS